MKRLRLSSSSPPPSPLLTRSPPAHVCDVIDNSAAVRWKACSHPDFSRSAPIDLLHPSAGAVLRSPVSTQTPTGNGQLRRRGQRRLLYIVF